MRNLFLAAALLLASTGACVAAGNESGLWDKANSLYQQKEYDSAAACYELLAAQKPQNAELYYNLGNTYYRLNKVALSVLNYERALRLSPDDKNTRDNLALAQGRISNHIQSGSEIFFINWWQALTQAKSATAWAVGAFVVFALMVVALLLRRLPKQGGLRVPAQVPGLLGFVCACLLVVGFYAAKNMQEHNGAVVMQNDAPLMGADLKGKPLILVPEGTTVKIRHENGAWEEVSLPDGRTGWLQGSLVEKI